MDSPLNSRHSLNSMLHNPVDLSSITVLGVSKSLNSTFDNCVNNVKEVKEKGDDFSSMRVFLRVRPTINESTAVIDSDHVITMMPPETSRRGQSSKMEAKQYASEKLYSRFYY